MRKPLILALLAIGGAATAAPPGWNGDYLYEQSLGRDLSGTTALFITHRLSLAPGRCTLLTEGVQTFHRVRCTAVPSRGGIEVRFASFDDRGGANALRPHYRPGVALLRLDRRGGALVTTWLAYDRAPDGARSGRFFRRR